jgi:integrase/recombinase XerD
VTVAEKKELKPVPGQPDHLRNRLLEYLEWRRVQNATPVTLKNDEYRLLRFVEWAESQGIRRATEVTGPIVRAYQRGLYEYRNPKTGKPMALVSQAGLLSLLRAFFKWLVLRKLVLVNVAAEVERPRLGQPLPQMLTAPEVEQVLAAADVSTAIGIRNRAILETLYSTGIRQSELRALRLRDLDLDAGTVHVRLSKGFKDRLVPLGARAMAWLSKYLDEVRPRLVKEEDPKTLFLSEDGLVMTSAVVLKVVRNTLDRAGIKKRGGAHLFRHAMATALLDGGADLRQVQQILGHANLTSTQLYTHVSVQKLVEVHARTHPAAGLSRKRRASEDSDTAKSK